MDPQTLLDKYTLENVPGITNLNTHGSPIDHEVFDLSNNQFFSENMDRLDGVQGRHLVSFSRRYGADPVSPLLRLVAYKNHPNYVNNINKFIELLTDGTVSRETIERYLNHYVERNNVMHPEIIYTPVLYWGRMDAEYIKFLGEHGFNPNLPKLYKDKRTGEFKKGLNALGLIDEDVGKYSIGADHYGNSSDSSDSIEDLEPTKGQEAAYQALLLGADMRHQPEDVLEKTYGTHRFVQPRLRPTLQLYPHTYFSDKEYRNSLQDDRRSSFNLYLDDQDRQEMEKRLPTTYLLQQLELLKPEQKLALAKFFEQTGIQGVDELFHLLEEITKHHDPMNPYVTRNSSGRSMSSRYLMDKQRGGKNTNKKQRGGSKSKRKGRRSKKMSR